MKFIKELSKMIRNGINWIYTGLLLCLAYLLDKLKIGKKEEDTIYYADGGISLPRTLFYLKIRHDFKNIKNGLDDLIGITIFVVLCIISWNFVSISEIINLIIKAIK